MAGVSLVLAAFTAPVFTSCYDDTLLVDRLDKVETSVDSLAQEVTALKTKLNSELSALQTLLEGKIAALQGEVDALVTVTSCKEQNDGSYEITLSDGKSFVVYPEYEQGLTGLVTTTTVGGVLCWAVYEDGAAVVVTDADGAPVPVVSVVPEVRIDENGVIELSFDGGNEWIEVGNDNYCVFTDAEVVFTDNYTDEEEEEYPDYYYETPIYVTLTLPDGSTISVTVDGAATFMFASNYGGPIKTQYVSNGSTVAIPVAATNIVDWVKEVPAGWIVEENTAYLADYGQAEFIVTAPSAEAVASGSAVAEGMIKVVAVAEGGKSVTASVTVTTKAFKSFSAGKGNFTVEMNNGLSGYLVGISPVADFDAEAILAELEPVVEYVPDPDDWMDYGWSPWYVTENETPLDDNYFDGTVTDYPVADLASDVELVAGEQYIVWAIGLDSWVNEATWESGYLLGSVETVTYLNANIDIETTNLAFNDIQISAEFSGVTSFYGGFSEKYSDDDIIPDLVSEINNYGSYYDQYLVDDEFVEGWENGVYTGDPNSLVSGYQKYQPSTTYYLYLIPVVEGKTKYTVSDVYYQEWTTPDLTAGGQTPVVAAEPVLEHKKVSVALSAEDAAYIYYYFVEPAKVSTIEDKAQYLLENGYMSEGGSVTANKTGLQPATTVTLLAMAVDQNGAYGDVLVQEYTSRAMEYSTVVVNAELQGTPAQTGKVKISCDSDKVDTYYYWYKSADHFTWGDSYYGTTADAASAYIALTPNSYYMNKIAAADLPEDGIIELTGLTVGEPYYFVIAAKLVDGETTIYTKATQLSFVPEMNLGNIVYATDDNGAENAAWTAAKPTVNAEVSSVGDFTTVSWSVDLPEGFSGITACFHEDYLADYPSAKSKIQYILTSEYIGSAEVVEGEVYTNNYASSGYNIYTVIWDAEGNYYEVYVEELNISGGFGV